jgi:hypothetical protein
MKFTILPLICCCLFSISIYAQTGYSVKGAVIDTAAKVKLENSSAIILNSKDSILRAFTRTAADGSFSINNLSKGNFILLITYPGYADYVERFTLDSAHTAHNFGPISMTLKSQLLGEVIVKSKVAAIKIKGDTTEFNAKAYVIQPNDKVEDLLKQLPGIQVDKDGKITAQGETVTNVLVDGEEFFGDDPTLVTQNLRADMVDKVQLYDKKSDQATFTGIDDGKKTKTINIVLREDKKNGLFGSLNGNIGTDGYYEGQLIFNRFKAKEKFALYGTAANDGRTGLGWTDASSLGADNGNVQFVDGGISINNTGANDALDSFSGYYNGKGIPVAQSGGVHYDDKWDADNQSLNTNYKLGAIDVTGTTNTTTQQTLPGGNLLTTNNENFNTYAFRQKLDLTYQIKLDTSSTLKLSTDGTFKNFHVNDTYSGETDSAGNKLNSSDRSIINHGDQQIFDITAFYTKKFKKVGRTLSWSLSESYNDNKTEGYLNSTTDFYKAGKVDSSEIVNQYKTTDVLSSVVNSNITYSEPLSKKVSLLFNYGLGINNTTSNNQSFNTSAPGQYNLLDSAYSNDYKFNQLTNQFGAIFNYKYGKSVFNFGSKASLVNFEQTDEYTGDVLSRNFVNWAPQAFYQYRASQQESFTVNYNGNNTQPTIQQIQPVLVNNDPLNITLGNPELKPSFTNRFNMFYNSYKVLSGERIFLSGNFSNTYDAIVNNTTTNYATGANTIQYVNLAGHSPYNYSLYGFGGETFKPLDMQIGLNLSTSGNVSYSYINSALDEAKSYTYSGQLSFQKYVNNKYNFNIQGGPSYTFSYMSLQPQSNNNAAGFNASGGFNLQFPLKLGAGSNATYTYQAKTETFSAEHLTDWTAYIYKTFTKDDKLKISLSVHDLLNQNTNFTRGIVSNTTTQTYTSGIRRFFMLSIIWTFNKFATLPTKN